VHLAAHTPRTSPQHVVFMQTSPLRQSLLLLQPRPLQHGRTHFLLPSAVRIQTQFLLLARSPLHSTSQPVPLSGHLAPSAAADTLGKKASTPAPKILVLINFSALRRERVPLASPLARASKEYSSIVSSRVASTLSSLSSAATKYLLSDYSKTIVYSRKNLRNSGTVDEATGTMWVSEKTSSRQFDE